MDWLRRLQCRLMSHRFTTFADGFKRRCARCDREEWVFSNPYPGIGEAKYFWREMDFDGLRKRRFAPPLDGS